MISDLIITYNDVAITDYFDVTSEPKRGLLASVQNSTYKIGNSNGEQFNYSRRDMLTIELELYANLNHLRRNKDDLARILNVSEPKQLRFSNEPDRYYLAIIDGDIEFDRSIDSSTEITGRITFLVPDGLAYAKEAKSFIPNKLSDGLMEVSIVNEGTEPVPIDFFVHHNHDNGYLAFSDGNKTSQFGKVDEVDMQDFEFSEQLVVDVGHEGLSESNGWTYGEGVNTGSGFGKTGIWVAQNFSGVDMITANDLGTAGTAVNGIKGAIMSKVIPADSEGHIGAKNFMAISRNWVETGAMGQTGLLEFVISDIDGNHLVSLSVNKNDRSGNTANITMHIKGKEVRRVSYEPSNKKFGKTFTGQDNGQLRIDKSGGQITFRFGGQTHVINDDSIEDIEAYQLNLYTGNWQASNKFISIKGWRYVQFIKNNVSKTIDIPNRYSTGTEVEIKGDEGSIYVDGVKNAKDEIKGSRYPLAMPGITTVAIAYSGFSIPSPDIVATITEAYV